MAFATVGGFLRKIASGTDGLGGLVVTTDSTDPLVVGSSPAGAPTTQSTVAATSTSADALPSNGSATYREIINNDLGTWVTLKLGSGTVTDYAGIVLGPGAAWDGKVGDRFYTGLVRCKTVSGTATLSVLEG